MDSFNGQDTLERTGSAVYEDFYLREDRGKPAINARIALGAFIVQTLLKTTDEETVEHIEEIPYIQCFLGLGAFTTEPIIASSSLSQIRERLSEEDRQAINEMLMDAIKGEENHWKTEKEEELVVEESIKREMDRMREVITERFRLWRYGPAEEAPRMFIYLILFCYLKGEFDSQKGVVI